MASQPEKVRNLIVVFGDQLNADAGPLASMDPDQDAVLMMEVAEEATYVPQHKIRLALFFSAMRHLRDELAQRGLKVHYSELDDRNNRGSFATEIARWVHKVRAEKIVCTQPGDYRVQRIFEEAARDLDCRCDIQEDDHFICSRDEFADFAADRKTLLLETFYRKMRRRHGILMSNGEPEGGEWNFDADNRDSFGQGGPGEIKAPRRFQADSITKDVLKLVERRFADSPGSLDDFDYPVTRDQARAALRDFVQHRLPNFGTFQDAMAAGHPYLYHSRLSCVLNLHLLDPRDAIDAAVVAYGDGEAPINAVEGFVRQILGWREFVRGVYWREMPDYADMNALGADLPMPAFMWTADTEMNCVRESVEQLVAHAYAHHIQRLMVLGLLALLLGVRPDDVHRWHMSMYADAVDWVSLPNVLGMSQYADGGIVGTKPYAASGNYINKMGDYCAGCRFDPKKSTGEDACPFTTLYWDFLSRNRNHLKNNRRMGLQFKNLDRKSSSERREIREQADRLKSTLTADTYL